MHLSNITLEIQNNLDASWIAYVEGDIKTLRHSLTQMAKLMDLLRDWKIPTSDEITLALCFRSYEYLELDHVSNDLRNEFGLLVGWRALFSHKRIFKDFYHYNWGDAYASLLSQSYFLEIDIKKLMWGGADQITGYEQEITEQL